MLDLRSRLSTPSLPLLLNNVKTFNRSEFQCEEIKTEDQLYGRSYVVNGCYYPSITTVLSLLSEKEIDKWRMRVGEDEANRISERATVKGTNVHEMAEKYLMNDLTDITKYSRTERDSFLRIKGILDGRIENIMAQEIPLYSTKYATAGRVDLIAEFDGVLSIIDFKTAGKEKQKDWILAYFIQATAYALMLFEMHNILIKQIVIIITVEFDRPQIFVENPAKYFDKFIEVRNEFKNKHGV